MGVVCYHGLCIYKMIRVDVVAVLNGGGQSRLSLQHSVSSLRKCVQRYNGEIRFK